MMSPEQILKQIDKAQGRFFRIGFVKRSTGKPRGMTARIGVRNWKTKEGDQKAVTGEGMKYDPKKRDLLPVYDAQKKDYRMVSLDSVFFLQVDGIPVLDNSKAS